MLPIREVEPGRHFLGMNSHAETIDVAILEFRPFACDPDEEEGKYGLSVDLEKPHLNGRDIQILTDS